MNNLNQTRREFLRMAGKVTLGAAALSTMPALTKAEEEIGAPEWPWTYQPIDKDEVQKRAYENFSTHGGCCAAVSSSIVETMAEKYGYPYNQIDCRMFANGAGGYGRRNLCGTLGGAFAVFGLFLTGSDSGKLRNELYEWYDVTAFPIYQPEGQPANEVQSVSGSELCADSAGKWMEKSGKEFSSPERLERCARLCADVAVKAVELLNIHFGFEAAPVVAEAPAQELAANEYIGTATSEIGGEVKVKVTMDGEKISKIDVISHGDTADFWNKAFPTVTQAIIDGQTTDVDTVASATKSSEAIIAAVKDALSQVK